MTNKEQRRKKDNIKPLSRLPIPTSTADATNSNTKLRHNKNTTTTAVTLSKLDNKKNIKSNLFATTCSRRAQEEKNYNKRPMKNNKSLSFFHLPSTPCKNNKNMSPSVHQKSMIPAAKKTTTSRVTQLQKPPTLRKSPLTQLKEDLEHLRNQNQSDEELIRKQNEEILNLKKQLSANNQPKKEAPVEERPSIEVVELLQVKTSPNNSKYEREINELQMQLKLQEDVFEKKLAHHTTIAIEMDSRIQRGQQLLNKLKSDHANQLAQLKQIHQDKMQKLRTDHEWDMNSIKNQHKKSITKPKTARHSESVNDIIELALREFEQEQHQHLPSPNENIKNITSFQQYDSNGRSLKSNILTSMMIKNQQWYTQNYMPVDAVSWPAPKALSHLKRVQQHEIC